MGLGEKFGCFPEEILERYSPAQMMQLTAINNYAVSGDYELQKKVDAGKSLTDAEYDRYMKLNAPKVI